MIFGETLLENCLDAVLAHALILPDRKLKKGHVLTQSDLAAVRDAGISSLVVARLDDEDVAENDAARRLAHALLAHVDGLEAADAATGRVNIYANDIGILQANYNLFSQLNSLNEGITLASLNDDVFVEAGRMVATVKVIPFAVSREDVARFEALCADAKPLQIISSKPHRVGLIATMLPSLKQSVMDKTRRVLEDRLAVSGSTVFVEERVPHTTGDVTAAIHRIQEQVDMIVLFGASAIVDRRDVLPTALEQAGGIVVHLGMPMDPGNLLMWGSLNGSPVIGAPGCARSPAENGFDRVLARCLTGSDPDPDYIRSLGVGGLLMEIHSRPQPREGGVDE